MPTGFAYAPAKAILIGEHAVVYGQPAIAVPLSGMRARVMVQALPLDKPRNLRIQAPDIGMDALFADLPADNPHAKAVQLVLDALHISHTPTCLIRITSQIPVAAGLGSGAAIAVATLRAFSNFLGHPLEDDDICQMAFEIEQLHHGTPSGIDNTVITYGKPVYFIKDNPILVLKLQADLTLLVADTGIAKSTVQTVARLRADRLADPNYFDPIITRIGEVATSARQAIESGNLRQLGQLMNENQVLLEKMHLSCPELDKLIAAARNADSLGAKLSGSGKGGHMLALVEENSLETVQNALMEAGAQQVYRANIQRSYPER